ncbi:lipoate protein ligase C-terminal domain-containing protein [Areca yellow leaf disease phytoplasma]|uniref:lipoate protein ligase C-terminal domain-containing protein n=1 Tax=Areca yellow leaf disease phytoplasma TaxID=927614 RepID=UPI0035B531D7
MFLDIRFGLIEKMTLIGDFFYKEDNLEQFSKLFEGITYQTEKYKKFWKTNKHRFLYFDATNDDFLSLLKEGILEEKIKNLNY